MQLATLRLLTWGTIVGAVLSAVWLATLAPQRPFGATLGEGSGLSLDDLVLPEAAPRAGRPASVSGDAGPEQAAYGSGSAGSSADTERPAEGQGKQYH